MKKLDQKQIQNIAIVLVLMGVSFYAGTNFPSKKSFGNPALQGKQSGTNRQFNPNNGGMVGGEIISKDDQSLSIKLRDGGSRIILFSTSTSVTKGTQGSIDDLTIGSQVTAVGTQNKDGSITAKTIQLRNDMLGQDIPQPDKDQPAPPQQ